jgi:hypothetical protein
MLRSRSASTFVCILGSVFLYAGCGGGASEYEGPKRYALSGKVTLDGELVDGGTISFRPTAEGTEGPRVTGGVITAGEYKVEEAQGANLGTYQVEIHWSRPTGEKVLDASDTGEMIDKVKQVIPAKYNENTELRADVTDDPEKNVFNFDLSTK